MPAPTDKEPTWGSSGQRLGSKGRQAPSPAILRLTGEAIAEPPGYIISFI